MPAQGQKPAYGRRLLVSILDEEARSMPERVFAAVAKSTDVSDGFRDVSIATIATAVDYLAHQLRSIYGPALEQDFETLTYIGLPDLRYAIVFYAAVKCGYKVTKSRHRPLLELTQCDQGSVPFATEHSLNQYFLDESDPIVETGLFSRDGTPG